MCFNSAAALVPAEATPVNPQDLPSARGSSARQAAGTHSKDSEPPEYLTEALPRKEAGKLDSSANQGKERTLHRLLGRWRQAGRTGYF